MYFIYLSFAKTFFLNIIVQILIIITCMGAVVAATVEIRDDSPRTNNGRHDSLRTNNGRHDSLRTNNGRHDPLRTIGGRDALPGEFPYVVRLELRRTFFIINELKFRTRNIHICTASVISPTATLTAAHCYFKTSFQFLVRYGSEDGRPSKNDRFSIVLDCIRLPSARSPMHPVMKDDLALLRTESIILRSYARISARDYHTIYGQRVFILGHGVTNHSGSAKYTTLQLKMPLQVVDVMWSQCEQMLRPTLYPLVCSVETCARHVAICKGDSGGPVMHASGVVGITSMGPPPEYNCQMRSDDVRYPYIDYIAPLSSNIDWISDKIAEMGYS